MTPTAPARPHVPTALLAAVTLVAGFAVVRLTGSQPLGGAVLVGGAAWCVLRERRRTAWWRLAVGVVVAVGAFALAHPAGAVVGAWPAVLLAGAVVGVVTTALVDRRPA